MSEKSIFFSNFSEIQSRPAFKNELEISPQNFHKLIGQYRLDEEVRCQVRTDNGICHQNHKLGWLGVTSEGYEALIGGHCATKYFKADKTFHFERKRVKAAIDRDRAIQKFNNLVTQHTENELQTLRLQCIEVRKIADAINKTFPDSVLKFITNAQKTQNWAVKIDVEEPGQFEDTKKRWLIHTLRNVKPIPQHFEIASLMIHIKSVLEMINKIKNTVPEELPTPKLNKINDSLSEIVDFQKKCNDFEKNLHHFMKADNLDSLIYVCDDKDEEYLATKAILLLSGGKVTDGYINLRLRRIKERTIKKFGGKNVRKSRLKEKYQQSTVFQ
ncbi:hypothetical protein RX799_03970 [Klebsiella oxytoca]|uniref:hypothetical protein n=1 Tax=Klebsiella oxytoca TaxID=571 RepID=UPI00384CB47E